MTPERLVWGEARNPPAVPSSKKERKMLREPLAPRMGPGEQLGPAVQAAPAKFLEEALVQRRRGGRLQGPFLWPGGGWAGRTTASSCRPAQSGQEPPCRPLQRADQSGVGCLGTRGLGDRPCAWKRPLL